MMSEVPEGDSETAWATAALPRATTAHGAGDGDWRGRQRRCPGRLMNRRRRLMARVTAALPRATREPATAAHVVFFPYLSLTRDAQGAGAATWRLRQAFAQGNGWHYMVRLLRR